ncbi:MAG TPA: hypothetical protein VHK91_05660 [Flavisolibacter sp.]|jgi:hypothetical protein|nr:hypothetical protein [Flavisolibacter sp.]
MARLVSAIKIKGTLDDITFYGGPDGETYVKMKSSLNAEKFWSWPSFENSRRSAQRMGMASRLTSLVYTCMEKGRAERTNSYRRKMVGVVFHWLKSGMTGMEVVLKLAEAMEVSIAVLKTRELCLRQHVTDYSAEGLETAAKKTAAVRRQTAEREEPIAFGLQLAVSKRISDYGLQMAVGEKTTDCRRQTSAYLKPSEFGCWRPVDTGGRDFFRAFTKVEAGETERELMSG